MIDPATLMAKAQRCLQTARLNAEDGDTDGACNRAYYAMFNAARAALLALGLAEQAQAKTHSGLIAAFGLHVVKPGLMDAEYGRSFSSLHDKRLLADYTGESLAPHELR